MKGAGGAALVGDRLTLDRALCAPLLYPKSPCRTCQEACTLSALRRDGGAWSLAPSCDGCGACAAACPTGALGLRVPAPRDIEASIRRRRAEDPAAEVRLTCVRAAERPPGVLVLPCAAALDEATIIRAALAGPVRVLVGDCRRCDRRERLARVFGRAVRSARAALGVARADPRAVAVERAGASTARGDGSAGPAPSRRDFFQRLARLAVAAIPAPAAEEPERALAKRRRWVEPIRRRAADDLRPGDFPIPFGRVSISGACFGCNVCEHVCAPGAIERAETKDGVRLSFDPALCHGCASCVSACMPGAVSLSLSRDAAALAVGRETVASLPVRVCVGCGLTFHSSSQDLCPRCARPGGDGRASPLPGAARLAPAADRSRGYGATP